MIPLLFTELELGEEASHAEKTQNASKKFGIDTRIKSKRREAVCRWDLGGGEGERVLFLLGVMIIKC